MSLVDLEADWMMPRQRCDEFRVLQLFVQTLFLHLFSKALSDFMTLEVLQVEPDSCSSS